MCAFGSPDRQFEDLLYDGISAVKSGNKRAAQSLLNRAIMIKPVDARPYLWLSATTDNPDEQREYLEKAVALDPYNVQARRGLALLTGKIDKSRMMLEGAGVAAGERPGDVQAQARSFKCPQCGGRMAYTVASGLLRCEYCGYQQAPTLVDNSPTPIADRAEQVLDFVMPTEAGHRWAEAQQHVTCEHCGAISLLPPGQKATQCAYCGSNQLVESPELGELMDPQVIAVMRIDEKDAYKRVRDWLGRGFLAPDDLLAVARELRLRPAYYSCWTFDGTLEVRWNCEVAEGSGNSKRWMPVSGIHMQFFNDVLVPGVKALTMRELIGIEPFSLIDVEEFAPEYLAGWPAMIYDRSLSDASLVAREKVLKQLRPQLTYLIEVGREKRNLNLGASSWSGMTFKHVLLPVWIGTYHYQGKEYHLLVNGQSGKVGGYKPRDPVKMWFTIGITLAFFVFLFILYWIWEQGGGGIFPP
ncbi:MAG: hypothetical protein AB1894_01640 [Chloroflexota bacterium]